MAFMRSPVRSRSGPPSFRWLGSAGVTTGKRLLSQVSCRVNREETARADIFRSLALHSTNERTRLGRITYALGIAMKQATKQRLARY